MLLGLKSLELMTQDTVDVIVVTFNRIKYFKTFVQCLRASTRHPFNLIVVDNGSQDGTRELVLKLEKEGIVWKYVFTESNLPLAKAFTEGFKVSESEFIVTVADDMIPPLNKEYDWLSIFVAKIKQDENVGCINFVGARCAYDSFLRKNNFKYAEYLD